MRKIFEYLVHIFVGVFRKRCIVFKVATNIAEINTLFYAFNGLYFVEIVTAYIEIKLVVWIIRMRISCVIIS